MLKGLLVAEVNPLAVACSVYPEPTAFIEQPENEATPADALSGFVVTVRVPLPGLLESASVTALL
jgi:hypothetical protein